LRLAAGGRTSAQAQPILSASVEKTVATLRLLDTPILELLEQHGSLAYEQVAAHLDERPDAVRNALADLRDRGLIAVLSVGELVGNRTHAAAYWRLTPAGRTELAKTRRF
jgi:predicted ArsR family transcriptional regulator